MKECKLTISTVITAYDVKGIVSLFKLQINHITFGVHIFNLNRTAKDCAVLSEHFFLQSNMTNL